MEANTERVSLPKSGARQRTNAWFYLLWLLAPLLLWWALRDIQFSEIHKTLSQLTGGRDIVFGGLGLLFSGSLFRTRASAGLPQPGD